jgi:hypothetical protein
MRSQGEGKGIQLTAPPKLRLERPLEYIGPDEYVEATPKNLRLGKNPRRKPAQARRAAAGHEGRGSVKLPTQKTATRQVDLDSTRAQERWHTSWSPGSGE